MAYGLSSVVGVFIGSIWDISTNHGYWITVVASSVRQGLRNFGLI